MKHPITSKNCYLPTEKIEQGKGNPETNSKIFDWRLLTDAEKSKIFLNSNRLPDEITFLGEFTSWEEPTNI
jgi:hypothetical protein